MALIGTEAPSQCWMFRRNCEAKVTSSEAAIVIFILSGTVLKAIVSAVLAMISGGSELKAPLASR